MHIGTALLVFEKRRRRPADKERAVQMHIHYGAPLVLVHFVKNAITQNDSVVDDAINAAIADVQAGRTGPIPRQLQNKHFDGEDAAVKGQNYKYAHDYENHWVDQQYLPDLLKDVKYYTFGDNRTEQAARAYWAKIKGEDKL
jgi:putative ATPase